MSGSQLLTANDTGERILPKPLSQKQKSRRSTDGVKDKMAPSPAFRRLWKGPDQLDYVAGDVTIRYFKKRPARPRTRINDKEENRTSVKM